jgi:hypothetical protein
MLDLNGVVCDDRKEDKLEYNEGLHKVHAAGIDVAKEKQRKFKRNQDHRSNQVRRHGVENFLENLSEFKAQFCGLNVKTHLEDSIEQHSAQHNVYKSKYCCVCHAYETRIMR